jgi:hypothetical protein
MAEMELNETPGMLEAVTVEDMTMDSPQTGDRIGTAEVRIIQGRSPQDYEAEIGRLRAENEELRAENERLAKT